MDLFLWLFHGLVPLPFRQCQAAWPLAFGYKLHGPSFCCACNPLWACRTGSTAHNRAETARLTTATKLVLSGLDYLQISGAGILLLCALPVLYSSMQFTMTNATGVELRQPALADGVNDLKAMEILGFLISELLGHFQEARTQTSCR